MIDGLLSFLGLRRASDDVESYDDDLDALLDEVRRIEAFARRLVRGVLAGGYTSVFRGAGLEFDVVREYEPGDDPRSVDWNVTARTGRPFVKKYVDEREVSVHFVVDLSPSTTGGFGAWSVRGTAARAVACLAFAAIANDDEVALVASGAEELHHVESAKGRAHALRVVRDCLALRGVRGGTSLSEALVHCDRVARRHGVVFVVSDFLEPGLGDALARLRRSRDVVAVRILAPEFLERGVGLERVRDPRSGDVRTLDWGSASTERAFADEVAHWRARVDAELRRARVDAMDVRVPREASLDAIGRPVMDFFRMRELPGGEAMTFVHLLLAVLATMGVRSTDEALVLRLPDGEVAFAEPFAVTVELRVAPGVAVDARAVEAEDLAPLVAAAANFGERVETGATVYTWDFECRAFELGAAKVGPLSVVLGRGDDRRLVRSASATLEVVATLDEVGDVEWPGGLRAPRSTFVRDVSLVLGLLALLASGAYAWSRRAPRSAGSAVARRVDDGSARSGALAELDSIASDGPGVAAPPRIAAVVRAYVAATTDVAAEERTTAELVLELRGRASDDVLGEVERLLVECDCAKFARVEWDAEEFAADVERARRVVASVPHERHPRRTA